jgi:hypothetical protein
MLIPSFIPLLLKEAADSGSVRYFVDGLLGRILCSWGIEPSSLYCPQPHWYDKLVILGLLVLAAAYAWPWTGKRVADWVRAGS